MSTGRGGSFWVCLRGQRGFDGAVKKYSWINPGVLLTFEGMAISTLGRGGSGQERYRSSRERRFKGMRYRWALLLRAERDGGGELYSILYSSNSLLVEM